MELYFLPICCALFGSLFEGLKYEQPALRAMGAVGKLHNTLSLASILKYLQSPGKLIVGLAS